jgi:hypothetical protein
MKIFITRKDCEVLITFLLCVLAIISIPLLTTYI